MIEEGIGVILDIIRLIIGILILGYASYTDIKTRLASNILWITMATAGVLLLIIQYFTVGFTNIYYLFFIPIMIGLFFVMYQLGLLFGGADAKALMAIAILVPTQPNLLNYPIAKTLLPFSFVIFVNSLILFLAIPIGLFIYNLTKKDFRFPHMFLGYKTTITKAKQKFVWPLEKIVDGKIKLMYMPKKFDAEDEYHELEKHGFKEIWVTPKVPFMIPLLAGYIFSFIIGDILNLILGL